MVVVSKACKGGVLTTLTKTTESFYDSHHPNANLASWPMGNKPGKWHRLNQTHIPYWQLFLSIWRKRQRHPRSFQGISPLHDPPSGDPESAGYIPISKDVIWRVRSSIPKRFLSCSDQLVWKIILLMNVHHDLHPVKLPYVFF